MQYYDTRPQAIDAAVARGWTMFDTLHEPGKGHYHMMTEGPIAEWAKVWAEDHMVVPGMSRPAAFVKHVGHRDRKPLVRLTCPVDELEPHERPPEQFIVEYACESMLASDTHTRGEKPVTGNARFDASLRARSTFTGSPVAFVQGMCDEMHKAGQFDRKAAVQRAIDAGIAANTANTQVYRWRKNNGM